MLLPHNTLPPLQVLLIPHLTTEEEDGEDELDREDTGPSGECWTKRGAPDQGGREEKKEIELE